MADMAGDLPLFDVTARKVHQWTMVALVVLAFLLSALSPLAAAIPLLVAGVVMLLGRFWWPADVVRQVTWRVLEPAGVLPRREVHEDHETRRIARVIGGTALLASALILPELPIAAWVIAFAIALMVALDAAVDFCALCFLTAQLRR
jgi:hypothetical protein